MATNTKQKKLIWELIIGILLTIVALFWETKRIKAQKKTSKRKSKK